MLNYFRTLILLSSNAFVFIIIIVTKLHQPPRYICNGWQGVKHQVTYLHYIRWLKPVRMTKKKKKIFFCLKTKTIQKQWSYLMQSLKDLADKNLGKKANIRFSPWTALRADSWNNTHTNWFKTTTTKTCSLRQWL